jgi:peptidyl-prolyl cis-trans isomerase-like 1
MIVDLDTSLGVISLELYIHHAPRACANFLELARIGYYDGSIFHRIVRDFIVQGGDPTGIFKAFMK